MGRLLLGQLERAVVQRRKTRVGLGVALANARARSLYERVGYSEAGVPEYVDRWRSIDAAGRTHLVEDPCVFLVKRLHGAAARERPASRGREPSS